MGARSLVRFLSTSQNKTWKRTINFGGLKLRETNRFNFSTGRKVEYTFLVATILFTFLAVISGAIQAATLWGDDFNDGSMDASKWRIGILTRGDSELDAGVRVAEQNGYLVITPRIKSRFRDFSGYVSVAGSNLTGGTAGIKIIQATNSKAETIFSIGTDKDNFLRFRAKGSTLYLENSTNGSTSSNEISYSSSTHRYWRFRHNSSANALLFETSSNYSSWTVRKTISPSFGITNLFVELSSGTSTPIGIPGSAQFDNFYFTNESGTTPTPTPTPTPGVTPTPTATPTPVVTPSPTPTPAPPAAGGSRGYLTTPDELRVIKQKADQYIQPYKASYDSLMSYVRSPSYWPVIDFTGVDVCGSRDSMQDGAALVYAKTLAYHLTGDSSYAASARVHILQMARSSAVSYEYGGGGNGCPLTLSRHAAGYIVAADLLAGYSGWTAADKTLFMDWLNNHVYHLVDWASDERSTNWGGDGSNAAGVLADYFANSGRLLRDRNGTQWTARDAYLEAKNMQLHRMNGTNDHSTGAPYPRMKNSVCRNFQPTNTTDGYAHGIQPSGGIPEETGRGSTGCSGTVLLDDDSAWTYMHTTLTGMVMQAEMLLRRGDRSMYDNINSASRGSLERAMVFTVTPFGAFDSRSSIFELGYRYYRNPVIGASIGIGGSRSIAGSGNTVFLHFGTLTHGFAPNENPGPPPTVPAP